MDGVGDDGSSRKRRADVVLIVIGHYIVGGDECRDVSASLLRQKIVDGPVILVVTSGTAQGFVHVAGTAVVSGNGERPVMIHLIELFQVGGCGFR